MILTQWHLWTGFWPLCLTCPQWIRKLVPECELWHQVPCSVQLTMFFSNTFFFFFIREQHLDLHSGVSSFPHCYRQGFWIADILVWVGGGDLDYLDIQQDIMLGHQEETNRCLSTVEGGQNPCKRLTDLWCYEVPSRQWYKNTNTLPLKWETSCFTLQSPEQKEPEDLVYLRFYIWVYGSDPSTK